MKLHNVPVMSRRGRPKSETNPNGQNWNDPNKQKTRRDTPTRAKNCEAMIFKCAKKVKKFK
jgi:hypothetical protein